MKHEILINQEDASPPTRLIPLTDWPKHHPWPPLGGLRHMVFHAKTNGFNKVLKRCGRRILIDEKKFFEYIDEQNRGGLNDVTR